MNLTGRCDFCGKEGTWEGGLFDDRMQVPDRPADWAASFPWTRRKLPKGCTFRPEDLENRNIETRFACPECFRLKNCCKLCKHETQWGCFCPKDQDPDHTCEADCLVACDTFEVRTL